MGFEAGAKAEEEKKKKEKSEKQKKQEHQKILEQEKQKLEARENSDKKDDALDKLEQLLDDENTNISIEDADLLKKVVEGAPISQEEIEEILEKIDEIENNDEVDKYIPQEFRITSEDYKQSLTDDIKRVQTITKLDTSLTILANHINPDSAMGLNLFTGYLAILDKNLVQIQENTIDVKDCLQKVEDKKHPPKKLSFLEKIKEFFRGITK